MKLRKLGKGYVFRSEPLLTSKMSKCLVIQVSLTAAERRNWHIKLHKDKSVHCWDNIIYDYSWTTMLASNKKIVTKIFCVLPLCRHCQSSGSSCLGDDLECHGAEGSDDSPWVCSSPCLVSCPPFYPRPSRPIMVQQTSSLRMTRMTGMQVIRCSSTDLSRWCWWDTTAGQLSQRMANIPTILGSVLNRKIWTLTQYLTIFTSGETEVCNFFINCSVDLSKSYLQLCLTNTSSPLDNLIFRFCDWKVTPEQWSAASAK